MKLNASDVLCIVLFTGSVVGLLTTIHDVNLDLAEMRSNIGDMQLELVSLREGTPRPLSFQAKKELEEIENDLLRLIPQIKDDFTVVMPMGDFKVITDFYCEHNSLMPERLDQYCPDAFTIVPGSERMFP
jgi:hypothetical protein